MRVLSILIEKMELVAQVDESCDTTVSWFEIWRLQIDRSAYEILLSVLTGVSAVDSINYMSHSNFLFLMHGSPTAFALRLIILFRVSSAADFLKKWVRFLQRALLVHWPLHSIALGVSSWFIGRIDQVQRLRKLRFLLWRWHDRLLDVLIDLIP